MTAFTPTRWTAAAEKVLQERYYAKDDEGRVIEDAETLCWRVATAVANAERKFVKYPPAMYGTLYRGELEDTAADQWAGTFRALLSSGDFLPNSPCLMNAGKENGLQWSACFVIPIEDSIESIFTAIKQAAIVHQSGGGTGFSFSRLRPKGSIVKASHGIASGPVSFLKIFNAATEQIKQGGTRRGANMAILRVDHPDILEFINCKRSDGTVVDQDGKGKIHYPIENFNISVGITDAFMEALKHDGFYDLTDPRDGSTTNVMRAQTVWDAIVACAWETGDPGLFFIDRTNRLPANPIPRIESIEATNPCGEIPLGPYDVCNLGSINLGRFLTAVSDREEPEYRLAHGLTFDWTRFRTVVRQAVRFLDDVIEGNPYPLPEIAERARNLRRIGLGVMGWADLLVLLGIPYESPEAVRLGNDVMAAMNDEAVLVTEELALERGAFPWFDRSRYKDDYPRRNSNLTAIAPTGTISLLDNCSSGIEPYFLLAYEHRVPNPDGTWRVLSIISEPFKYVAEREGFWSAALEAHVIATGSVQGRDDVPAHWQHVLRCANEIAPTAHVAMQAAWQTHVEQAISKTINLPESATIADIDAIYRLADESECVGITVYRNNCKGYQPLAATRKEQPKEQPDLTPIMFGAQMIVPIERPEVLTGMTHRIAGPAGNLYVTINREPAGEPLEVFVAGGKPGSEMAAVQDALGRLISHTLQLEAAQSPTTRLRGIADQLRGLGGNSSNGFGPHKIRSVPDAVAAALDREQPAERRNGSPADTAALLSEAPTPPALLTEPFTGRTASAAEIHANGHGRSVMPVMTMHRTHNADLCPECHEMGLVRESGCEKCLLCGYDRC